MTQIQLETLSYSVSTFAFLKTSNWPLKSHFKVNISQISSFSCKVSSSVTYLFCNILKSWVQNIQLIGFHLLILITKEHKPHVCAIVCTVAMLHHDLFLHGICKSPCACLGSLQVLQSKIMILVYLASKCLVCWCSVLRAVHLRVATLVRDACSLSSTSPNMTLQFVVELDNGWMNRWHKKVALQVGLSFRCLVDLEKLDVTIQSLSTTILYLWFLKSVYDCFISHKM